MAHATLLVQCLLIKAVSGAICRQNPSEKVSLLIFCPFWQLKQAKPPEKVSLMLLSVYCGTLRIGTSTKLLMKDAP